MRRYLLSALALLALMAAACGSGNPGAASQKKATATPPPTSTAASTNMLDCPAPGTARAATLPPLTAGSHQTIVYIDNQGQTGIIKRYDVVTGTTTEIISLPQFTISEAQVSADGQWVLFVTTNSAARQPQLRLVRLDGQDLQTLYCATPPDNGANSTSALDNIQWSPDQQRVVFNSYVADADVQVDLLNLASGTVQTVFSNKLEYPAAAWLDNTRVYLDGPTVDSPSMDLYLLDTSRGTNQTQSNLLTVFQAETSGGFPCWDAAPSADRSQLFLSTCSYAQTGSNPGPGPDTLSGPSLVSVLPTTGGDGHRLYSNQTLGLSTVRAVSATVLLVVVKNYAPDTSVDTSQNGLWELHTDGSGFTRLVPQSANQQIVLAQSQYPWANGSRDEHFYAVTVQDNTTSTLLFGSLSGGAPTTFATSAATSSDLRVVGWTTF